MQPQMKNTTPTRDQNETDERGRFIPGHKASGELKKNSEADADVRFGFIFREHGDCPWV